MSSSCRFALLLALGLAAVTAAPAQSSSYTTSSSSSLVASASGEAQTQAGQPAAQSQGQMSVQARIKARREQRRAAAIHEAYAHRYEEYTGMGYLRFNPGSTLERAHEYAWNLGVTRFFDERLGITVDGRGYYGTAYVGGLNNITGNAITNPAISQYSVTAGPTYRFYLQPKYSVALRVLGGFEKGDFSGDVNHNESDALSLGLWPDGYTYALTAGLPVEYNLTPAVGLRVTPEYRMTGFGSTVQNNLGFTASIVYRFGKQ